MAVPPERVLPGRRTLSPRGPAACRYGPCRGGPSTHVGSGNMSKDRQTPYFVMRGTIRINLHPNMVLHAELRPYQANNRCRAEAFTDRSLMAPSPCLPRVPERRFIAPRCLQRGPPGVTASLPPARVGSGRGSSPPGTPTTACFICGYHPKHADTIRTGPTPGADLAMGVSEQPPHRVHVAAAAASHADAVAVLLRGLWEIEIGFRYIESAFPHDLVTRRSKTVASPYQQARGYRWPITWSGAWPGFDTALIQSSPISASWPN